MLSDGGLRTLFSIIMNTVIQLENYFASPRPADGQRLSVRERTRGIQARASSPA
jgi:hypothetical protein